jgi:ribokinase
MRAARIAVVGSFVTDLVFRAPRRPERGETLIGHRLDVFEGGKGFNQAVAAARAGAEVVMIGRIGVDEFGTRFLSALARENIDATYVVRDEQNATGVASPLVEDSGHNSIVLVPRANAALTSADVERARAAISAADVLLVQLEVPMLASVCAAEIARHAGRSVVLNPAPALAGSEALIAAAHVVVPNELEAATLTSRDSAGEAARTLRERGVPVVVVTLGERGSLLLDASGERTLAAHAVDVVDTTAAGDAFCGALAVALAEGAPANDAVAFANAAGALAVTRLGAEPSMPKRAAIEELLRTAQAAR